MKFSRFLALAAAGAALIAFTAEAKTGWLDNYEQAQKQAKAENKLLLLDFTGSDWCSWCIRLDKEVFSRPEFVEYARKNLVLMEVDFPRGKPITSRVRRQNERLADKHGIQVFPTIVVLDGNGRKLGELGYMPGGPIAFIAELEKLRKS